MHSALHFNNVHVENWDTNAGNIHMRLHATSFLYDDYCIFQFSVDQKVHALYAGKPIIVEDIFSCVFA